MRTECPSAFQNRCVFSLFLKLSALSDGSRRSSGSAFQAIRPATENARRPSVLRRCRGTTRWWRLEDRSRWRLATPDVGWQQFMRYWEPCLGDTGELSLRAYGGSAEEHRASAARSEADVSSLGRTSQYYWRHGTLLRYCAVSQINK